MMLPEKVGRYAILSNCLFPLLTGKRQCHILLASAKIKIIYLVKHILKLRAEATDWPG